MPRFAELLAQHRRILVLDAASTRVVVGLLRRDESGIWFQSTDEAGRAIFKGVAEVLAKAGDTLDAVDAFAYCSGPGSVLGIRTVAMALRTWQTVRPRPAYAYQSLAFAARAEWRRRPRAFSVICDARRESWHLQAITSEGLLAPLRRVATAELPAGELLQPAHFRTWSAVPAAVAGCPYAPEELPTLADDHAELFQAVMAADAFRPEAPEYKKWTAQVHSAEAAKR